MSDSPSIPAPSAPSAVPSPSAPAVKANPTASAPNPTASGTNPPVSVTKADSPYAEKTAEGGDVAKPSGETQAEKKRRLMKLKVHGQELEYDVDNTPDEELAMDLQMGKAARKTFQEAAEARKERDQIRAQFQELVQLGKQSPHEALEKLFGVNSREWAENYLKGIYTEESLPEGEKEKLQLKRDLEAREAKLKEYEEAQKRQTEEAERTKRETAQAEMDKQVHAEMQATFSQALEASGLPQTRETLIEMARIAKLNLEHGIELTPAQIAHEAKKRLQGVNQAVFRNLKGAALESYLGADVVKEIVRMSVEKVRGAKKPAFDQPSATPAKADAISSQEEMRELRRQAALNDWKKTLRGG